MIVLSIDREAGKIRGFSVEGHARSAPHGEDLVCAAVSMLAQSVLLGLHHHVKIGIDYDIDEAAGRLTCRLPAEMAPEQYLKAEAVIETMVLGCQNLQETYPKYVRVK
ncbi:MAG: ribosomal-processing cysteine protease Prp [Bacillota bacterium]